MTFLAALEVTPAVQLGVLLCLEMPVVKLKWSQP
jgi:hypothetical protein